MDKRRDTPSGIDLRCPGCGHMRRPILGVGQPGSLAAEGTIVVVCDECMRRAGDALLRDFRYYKR